MFVNPSLLGLCLQPETQDAVVQATESSKDQEPESTNEEAPAPGSLNAPNDDILRQRPYFVTTMVSRPWILALVVEACRILGDF